MATYTTKYYSRFYDLNHNQYVINLKTSGTTSGATQLPYYDQQPFLIEQQGGRDQADMSVFGSSATFAVYVDETQGQNLDEIMTSDYHTWQVEFSGSSSYWIGFINTSLCTRPFLDTKYPFNITAVDGLADLKNIFLTGATQLTGLTTVIGQVKLLTDQTGLSLPISDQMNITNTFIASGASTLINLYTHKERFLANGAVKNCYQCLQNLIEPYKARLEQVNGYWHITQKNEVNSMKHIYAFPNPTAYTTSNFDRSVDVSTYIYEEGSDQLSKVYPLKQYNALSVNKNITGGTTGGTVGYLPNNYLPNSTFNTGISNWVNSSGATTTWHGFSWDSTNKNLLCDEPVVSNPNTEHWFYSKPVYIQAGTNLGFSLSADINLSVCTFTSGSLYPFFRFLIKYPPAATGATPSQRLTFSAATYTYNSVPGVLAAGYYQFGYSILPDHSQNYSHYTVSFDNLILKINFPNSTTDTLETAVFNPAANPALTTGQTTIYYNDSLSFNDIGAILSNTPIPSGQTFHNWSNYPPPKLIFGNYSFSGGTLSPWTQSAQGGTQAWAYNGGLTNDITAFSSTNTETWMVQQGTFKPGFYTLGIHVKNNCSIVGLNPNAELNIYCITATGSTLIGQVALTSDGSYHTLPILVDFPQTGSFGFQIFRFGPGGTLDVGITQVDINLYNANDYNLYLWELYLYNTLRKLQTSKNYLNVTVWAKQNIFFNSVLKITRNGITKYYEISDYSWDVLSTKVSLQLSEILSGDANLIYNSIALKTKDGQ